MPVPPVGGGLELQGAPSPQRDPPADPFPARYATRRETCDDKARDESDATADKPQSPLETIVTNRQGRGKASPQRRSGDYSGGVCYLGHPPRFRQPSGRMGGSRPRIPTGRRKREILPLEPIFSECITVRHQGGEAAAFTNPTPSARVLAPVTTLLDAIPPSSQDDRRTYAMNACGTLPAARYRRRSAME